MTRTDRRDDRAGCACGHGGACRPTERRRRRHAGADGVKGSECQLQGTLVLDGKRVPVGRCWVKQTRSDALLSWTASDGADHAREISLELLRQLLAEGLLQRHRGAA
jgi:hypothetical protein